jgi:arylsulfatase A-like enzyme
MADQGAPSESRSTPRGRSFVWMGVVLAAAVVWGVMRTGEPGEPPGDDPTELLPARAATGFNLLFVTIDTTRPDHLGCYGDAGARTPALDALAERGVRFADATVHVPLTLPSHATMLTGRYPPAIGVRTNGDVLSDRHATLAEVLSSNGYATAAFVATYVLDKRWGLAQGFDTYDFHIGVDDVRGADSLMGERKANEVSDSVLAWLKKRKASGDDQPFFAWVHYYDPHHPYVGPQPLVDRFTDRSHPTYDAEIALVDIQLERIFDRLRREGLWEKTLVVVATDHGESLGDIAEAFHGIFLYETTMRAALLFPIRGFSSAGSWSATAWSGWWIFFRRSCTPWGSPTKRMLTVRTCSRRLTPSGLFTLKRGFPVRIHVARCMACAGTTISTSRR